MGSAAGVSSVNISVVLNIEVAICHRRGLSLVVSIKCMPGKNRDETGT